MPIDIENKLKSIMNTQKIKNLSLVLLSSIAIISCDDDENTDNPIIVDETIEIPEQIEFTNAGFYPEGIDYNNNTNDFFVGSVLQGEIGTIDPETGTYETFITREDDPNLVSVTGIFTDEDNNRLLAASGNPGLAGIDDSVAQVAYLGIYDLETAEVIAGIDLTLAFPEGQAFVANDIAIGPNRNIFVTDSFSPVIYQVDGTTFEASVFINGGDDFTPVPNGFGLNGLVYTNGNLIACKTDDGTLIRIPLDTPEDYQIVDIDMDFIGADGLELTSEGDIVVVNNGFAGDATGTYLLNSTDDWVSATVTAQDLVSSTATTFPTTATLAADGEIYAVNSYFSLLFAGDTSQETFSIVRANL